MTNPTKRSAHPITQFILRATEAEDAAHAHLDENDLALLEMGALNDLERIALRRILISCPTCRTLVSQVLKQVPLAAKPGPPEQDLARMNSIS